MDASHSQKYEREKYVTKKWITEIAEILERICL